MDKRIPKLLFEKKIFIFVLVKEVSIAVKSYHLEYPIANLAPKRKRRTVYTSHVEKMLIVHHDPSPCTTNGDW